MAKNYIKGSFREIKIASTDSTKLVCSFLVDDLVKIANEKGYAQVVIQERKDPDSYGNTHYAFENDYKPDPNRKPASKVATKAADKLASPKFKEDLDDNPFA